MQIVKYQTEEESQQIIAAKQAQGLTLVEVANITEGNFLGFKEPDEFVTFWKGLFIQALKDRITAEGRIAEDIIAEYTALSAEDKAEILNSIGA